MTAQTRFASDFPGGEDWQAPRGRQHPGKRAGARMLAPCPAAEGRFLSPGACLPGPHPELGGHRFTGGIPGPGAPPLAFDGKERVVGQSGVPGCWRLGRKQGDTGTESGAGAARAGQGARGRGVGPLHDAGGWVGRGPWLSGTCQPHSSPLQRPPSHRSLQCCHHISWHLAQSLLAPR